ncbi:DUF6247 family protein [Nonomuraea wenchangensis]|uniref:DUF6247 family protein n=1 Tax=Nonomuraea wenchangensis TaxID=568860 RepID=UPI0033D95D80
MSTTDRKPHNRSEVAAERFSWIGHLTADDMRAFTLELAQALHDPESPQNLDDTVWEILAGWRATALIKADPEHYAEALRPTTGDFGRVERPRGVTVIPDSRLWT